MKNNWIALESWLSANWPEGLTSLNPPATDKQISDLERELGFRLPADFVECLKIHNGQCEQLPFFDRMYFLSCEAILTEWRVWKELLDGGDFNGILSSPEDGIKNDWWNTKWIPFTHNGSGDHLCIDADPSASGSVGQVITMWHDMDQRERVSASFGDYFAAYVAGVLAGDYVYCEDFEGLVNKDDASNED
jgi:cell wall assembly regulator SMI1